VLPECAAGLDVVTDWRERPIGDDRSTLSFVQCHLTRGAADDGELESLGTISRYRCAKRPTMGGSATSVLIETALRLLRRLADIGFAVLFIADEINVSIGHRR
jgi:hypothetical protein